ncbi:hypothetical protein [Nocardia brasiliensis]|uniref:hypothetical protein n=1 Tax=Nocardia brasiliensis TaxID=37326 RepID=UPI0004A73B4F|nr:hypothetical protein [Nocardia brasiliensis]
MITFDLSSNPPFLATVLGVTAVSVMATAVLLTADRTPTPVSYQASTRPDGCVMFCEDVPKPSFNDANCGEPPPGINFRLWKCDPIRTPQPKAKAKPTSAGACIMFCDEPRRGDR